MRAVRANNVNQPTNPDLPETRIPLHPTCMAPRKYVRAMRTPRQTAKTPGTSTAGQTRLVRLRVQPERQRAQSRAIAPPPDLKRYSPDIRIRLPGSASQGEDQTTGTLRLRGE